MLVYQRVLISISEDSEINITRQIWEYVICMILYVVFTGAQGVADFLSQNSGHPTFLVNGPSRPFKLAPLAPRQTFEQGLPGRRPRGCFWPWDAGDFSPSKIRMNRSDRELWWATCPSATHLPPEVASIRHPDWFQSPWPQQPGQGSCLFHVGIWHDLLALKPEKTWVFCWAWFFFGDFFEFQNGWRMISCYGLVVTVWCRSPWVLIQTKSNEHIMRVDIFLPVVWKSLSQYVWKLGILQKFAFWWEKMVKIWGAGCTFLSMSLQHCHANASHPTLQPLIREAVQDPKQIKWCYLGKEVHVKLTSRRKRCNVVKTC